MIPPPTEGMRRWADRHRILSTSVSAEPGPWQTARVPYMKQVLDCLSPDSPARIVTLMKGSQVGSDRRNFVLVRPHHCEWAGQHVDRTAQRDTAREWSKQRLTQL